MTQQQGCGTNSMIDNFALGLAHLLIALAVWRMVMRMDLDTDGDGPADA